MPSQIAQFLAQPFTGTNMSAVRWFLFVGFLIMALVIWHMIWRELSSVEPEL